MAVSITIDELALAAGVDTATATPAAASGGTDR